VSCPRKHQACEYTEIVFGTLGHHLTYFLSQHEGSRQESSTFGGFLEQDIIHWLPPSDFNTFFFFSIIQKMIVPT